MARERCVDHAYQIDIQDITCRFFQLPVLIRFKLQVVGTGDDAGIGENVVDSAVLLHRLLEECSQVAPDGHILFAQIEVQVFPLLPWRLGPGYRRLNRCP